MDNERIAAILKEHYGIIPLRIEQLEGGWSALAFQIRSGNQQFFLKAYDQSRPASVRWIRASDRYIPLVRWLNDHTELKGHIIQPIATRFNRYLCDDKEYIYLLTEYLDGEPVGEKALSVPQVDELAKILGVLHRSTSHMPGELMEKQEKEDFDTTFCDALYSFISHDLSRIDDAVLYTVNPYGDCLRDCIARIRQLSGSLRSKPPRFVLCHADAHSWNLIQGQKLALIDWECVRLAPQEQDIVLYMMEPFAAQFLSEYRKYIDYDEPDLDALEFYYLKRKLEDIWEWLKNLRVDGLVKPEETTYHFLRLSLEGCAHLDRFRSHVRIILY